MREIKFRAQSVHNKKWCYGWICKDYSGTYYITTIDGVETTVVDPKTVGQFTGLLDKNGKEIFESDILKTQTGIASVIWGDASFALLSPGSEAVDWCHSSVYELSEIIGNIHENPELL